MKYLASNEKLENQGKISSVLDGFEISGNSGCTNKIIKHAICMLSKFNKPSYRQKCIIIIIFCFHNPVFR